MSDDARDVSWGHAEVAHGDIAHSIHNRDVNTLVADAARLLVWACKLKAPEADPYTAADAVIVAMREMVER